MLLCYIFCVIQFCVVKAVHFWFGAIVYVRVNVYILKSICRIVCFSPHRINSSKRPISGYTSVANYPAASTSVAISRPSSTSASSSSSSSSSSSHPVMRIASAHRPASSSSSSLASLRLSNAVSPAAVTSPHARPHSHHRNHSPQRDYASQQQYQQQNHHQHTSSELTGAHSLHVSAFGGRIFEFADNTCDLVGTVSPHVAQV